MFVNYLQTYQKSIFIINMHNNLKEFSMIKNVFLYRFDSFYSFIVLIVFFEIE